MTKRLRLEIVFPYEEFTKSIQEDGLDVRVVEVYADDDKQQFSVVIEGDGLDSNDPAVQTIEEEDGNSNV